MSVSVNIHAQARCELLESVLSRKSLDPKRGIYDDFVHLLFLISGSATALLDEQRLEMQAGSVVYISAADSFSISMSAGSSACLLGVSPDLLIELLGASAESVLLREFSERSVFVDEPDTGFLEELHYLSQGLMNEVNDPQRGSRMAVAAYFRLVLMGLWRISGSQRASESGLGEITRLLQRFRHLVEMHYRERWTVRQYAEALLVSHDRLHAICTRTLSKTPLQLIQERVMFEAKLRLEKSGHSIQQLAHDLGFTDSTTFSHYFKRYAGTTPAVFRKMSKQPQAAQQAILSFGYSDWP